MCLKDVFLLLCIEHIQDYGKKKPAGTATIFIYFNLEHIQDSCLVAFSPQKRNIQNQTTLAVQTVNAHLIV